MTPNEIKSEFIKLYGGEESDIRVFYSPGRVNLIGEHTDYNGGFVFPAALTMGTMIALRVRGDNTIRMKATDLPDAFYEALERWKTEADEIIKGSQIQWYAKLASTTFRTDEIRRRECASVVS